MQCELRHYLNPTTESNHCGATLRFFFQLVLLYIRLLRHFCCSISLSALTIHLPFLNAHYTRFPRSCLFSQNSIHIIDVFACIRNLIKHLNLNPVLLWYMHVQQQCLYKPAPPKLNWNKFIQSQVCQNGFKQFCSLNKGIYEYNHLQ